MLIPFYSLTVKTDFIIKINSFLKLISMYMDPAIGRKQMTKSTIH